MGRHRKKKPKSSKEEPKELVKAPHSFVIHRGKIGKHLEHLLRNVRQILEPFTASHLKVRKKNTVKDFVSISSYLNVTHMIIFTQTSLAPYMRLCRVPRGPTITYKILEYTLTHDVVAGQRRPHINTKLFQSAPLLILNGFGGVDGSNDSKIQLQTSMWRNLLPSIDIHKVQLSKIRRCLLLDLDPESNEIELRHYAIKVKPVGLSKMINKLVSGKKIPDLGQFRSVEDAMKLIEPESEAEDDQDPNDQVTLPQKVDDKRGNLVNEKSSIKLYELGPRIRLQLIKVEDGIMSGEVLYHSHIQKTAEEIKEQKAKIDQRNFLKLSRKRQQEENVRKKQEEEETKKPKRRRIHPDLSLATNTENDSTEPEEKFYKVDENNEEDDDEYQISEDEMMPLDDADDDKDS